MYAKIVINFLLKITLYLLLISFSKTNGKDFRYSVKDALKISQATRHSVVNPDTIISLDYADSITSKLKYLQTKLDTKSRLVVLPCINTNSPEFFSQTLFDSLKLETPNSKNAYGILFLLVNGDEQECFYMVTGKRTEKTLTDEHIKVMQLVSVIPLLREGKLGEGVYAAVKETARLLESISSPPTKKQISSSCFFSNEWWFFLLLLPLLAIYFYYKRKRF